MNMHMNLQTPTVRNCQWVISFPGLDKMMEFLSHVTWLTRKSMQNQKRDSSMKSSLIFIRKLQKWRDSGCVCVCVCCVVYTPRISKALYNINNMVGTTEWLCFSSSATFTCQILRVTKKKYTNGNNKNHKTSDCFLEQN